MQNYIDAAFIQRALNQATMNVQKPAQERLQDLKAALQMAVNAGASPKEPMRVVWDKVQAERAASVSRETLSGTNAEKDPNGIDAHTSGAKLDAGKTRPWLMYSGFAKALGEVAKVTTKGAEKYTPNGWKDVANGPERYMEAFGRHMQDLGQGETVDADTGCLHKAQMVWNLLASMELEAAK